MKGKHKTSLSTKLWQWLKDIGRPVTIKEVAEQFGWDKEEAGTRLSQCRAQRPGVYRIARGKYQYSEDKVPEFEGAMLQNVRRLLEEQPMTDRELAAALHTTVRGIRNHITSLRRTHAVRAEPQTLYTIVKAPTKHKETADA